jgi:hypothetical protein
VKKHTCGDWEPEKIGENREEKSRSFAALPSTLLGTGRMTSERPVFLRFLPQDDKRNSQKEKRSAN